MRKTSDLKLILFFTALTFLLTVVVVFAWEKFLLPPFYSWVDARYPGAANAETRWKVQQRVEHFFISITVDMVVVTLLLRVVRRQHRREEEMRRQLYQTSKLAAVDELSAGVAHEINNPLNGIINFAELLKDEPAERPAFERQMIDGIIDEGGRIAQIVRGLLTFARPDSHEPGRAHVAETVRTSIALFGRRLEKDGVRVEVEVEPDLPPVRADGSRLRQVVVNMISNAHHALLARDGGRERLFRISARRGKGEGKGLVCLEFYDNGVGIREEDLERVFEPFFTTRREAGGTGLGLSISFGIVRDYGGTIRAESREGEFTRFVVELPAEENGEGDGA